MESTESVEKYIKSLKEEKKRTKVHRWVGGLVRSSDSKLSACIVRENNQEFIILGGKILPDGRVKGGLTCERYHEVWGPTFSPDSKHFAYCAEFDARHSFVVLDGKQTQRPYNYVGYLHFSSDSKHLAYSARQGKEWRVVLDGKELETKSDSEVFPEFSPDSKTISYQIKHQDKESNVLAKIKQTEDI